MSIVGNIAKNTTYLSLSSILQKVLAFVFYVYIARQLGDEMLGRYAFALSFTGIFVIIMNFGLVPVLTREGAKNKDLIKDRLEFILGAKIVITIVTLLLMALVFHFLNQYKDMPLYTIQLVYLASIMIIFDTFRSIFLAVLRALQQMKYEALGQIIYQTIFVVIGSLMLYLGYKAQALISVIIFASFVYCAYALYIVIAKANIKPRLQWRPAEFLPLLTLAAPFALADIFFKLSGSIDTVMLEYLAGDRFVGWYNIALKLTVTLTILPGAFATAFFPAMSRAYIESKDQLRSIFERTFSYLLIMSLPISVGVYVLAPKIITTAFPAQPAAIPSLQIFMLSVVFLFVNYPVGNTLNASNRQGINTLNMGIALLVNVLLNIWLIPAYTYMGATVAAVISNILLLFLGLPWVYRIVHYNILSMLSRSVKALIASLVMGAILYYTPQLNLIVSISMGTIIYGLVLFMVRGITIKELKQLVTIFTKKSLV